MIAPLFLATFAGVCGVGVSYPARAPGDTFAASSVQRRWGRILGVLAGVLALTLLGIHPHPVAACVALLWSLALCGPLLCCLRWLGPRCVLSFGAASLIGALAGSLLR